MSPSTGELAPPMLQMPITLYESHCRPQLGMLFRFLGLDVEYVEASGDRLVAIDGEGRRREVWDFLGGFGSTILGHNSDVVAQELARLVARKVPVHAQASARVEAGKLAARLNELLSQSLGLAAAAEATTAAAAAGPSGPPLPPPPPRFFSLFVATGTEAVEAAIKHALMAWDARRAELLVRVETARCALLQEKEDDGGSRTVTRPSQLLAALDDSARRLAEASPVFLAVRGSYHGRTAGSLAVTANAAYGVMYQGRSAVEARFLPRDPGEADVERALSECRLEGLVPPPSSSSSSPSSAPSSSSSASPFCSFSRVAACFVEWIQGEGGMRPMPGRSARALSRALRRERVPLVADEIQTGLFRTGTFLASEHYNDRREREDPTIVPDYVLLGKSLGGGIAKLAAVCIGSACYEPEFGRLHSSTFADDDLSCAIGLKVLDELCGAGPRTSPCPRSEELRARSEGFEQAVRACVERIQRRHPGVVREVRGRGLMLGVELDVDLGGTAPVLLQALNQTGMTPYALCSWLLNRRGVRVGATLNDEGDGVCDEAAVERVRAPTLRLEPSAFVPREAVAALVGALEEVCGLLHGRRLAELLGPVLRQDRLPKAAAVGAVTTTTMAVGVCSLSSSSSSTSTSLASFSSSSSRFSLASTSPLWSVMSPPRPPPIPFARQGPVRKAVFLSHLIDERHVAALDPALRSFLSPARRAEFFSGAAPLAGSAVYHEQLVTFGGGGDGGSGRRGGEKRILLQLRGVFATSEFFERSARAQDGLACRKVAEAARVAVAEGADVVGLGQFTSIVTQNGVALLPRPGDNGAGFHSGGGGGNGWDNPNNGSGGVDDRLPHRRRSVTLTTGNSLTVGLAYRALLGLLRERGKTLRGSRVAVIGAAGNICRTYAELLAADGVGSLLLVHREPLAASAKFRDAHRRVSRAAAGAFAARTGASPTAAAEAASKVIEATHLLNPVAGCDVVVSGTNSTRQFLKPIHLARGAVVLDVSVPSNVSRGVLALRPDVECFQGANAALPGGQKLFSPLVPTDDGNVFACMGETAALAMIAALEDDGDGEDGEWGGGAQSRRRRHALRGRSHSVGALSREGVLATLEMADRVGIGLGLVKRMSNAEAAAAKVAEGSEGVPNSRL